MSLFRKRMLKKVSSDGTLQSQSFVVLVNNEPLKMFDSKEDALAYLFRFRNENQIFSLSFYRVDTYSLT